ncbi:MAG: translocation/assembly module TamB [Myxococcaceae bacterium]|nr:translocation/assembly module TamB [Myxococcaceae bacterium]
MTPSRRLKPRHVLLVGLLLLVAAVAVLRTRMAAEGACTLARRHLPELLGLEVGIGSCAVDPLTQEVQLRGLSLFRPGETTPILAVDAAEVRLPAVQPWFGGVRLERVRLDRPRLTLDLSRPSADPGHASDVCPLDVLRRLEVGRLEVKGARVSAVLPGGAHVEVEGLEVAWHARRDGTELQLRAPRGAVRALAAGETLALHQLAVEGVLSVEDGTLQLSRAEVALDEALLSVVGRVEKLCQPTAALDGQLYLPLPAVGRAAGWGLPLGGHAWTRFTLTGPLDAPEVRADLSAHALKAGPYAPGDFTARLSLSGRKLKVDALTFKAGTGDVRVDGTLELTRSLPARLSVSTREASFARVLERAGLPGAWVDFPATAQATLSGTFLPAPQLTGEVSLRSGRFVLATRAFDAPAAEGRDILTFAQGDLTAGVRLHHDRAEFTGVQLSSGGTKARGEVTLFYAPERGLVAEGTADLALGDFGAIAELPWKGRGGARFSVRGPYGDVKAEADLSLRDFELWDFALGVVQGKLAFADDVLRFPGLTGQKGRTQYFGDAQLSFRGPSTVHLQLSLPGGRAEDLVDVLAPQHRAIAAFQGELTGMVEGRVGLTGPFSRFGGEVALSLKDTRLRGRRMGDGAVAMHFEDGHALVLDSARLEGVLGRTFAEGRWDFESNALDYRFRGDALSLAEVWGAEDAQASGITGTLALEGKVAGDTDTPLVTGSLRAPRVTFAGRDLGALTLEGRVVGTEAHVFGRPFRDANGSLQVRFVGDWPYEASLSLALPEIRPLLPDAAIAQGVSGTLSGKLSVAGMAYRPESLRMAATVDKLALSRGEFRGQAEGEVVLSYAGGRLEVQPFTFRGPGTDLRGAGAMSDEYLEARLEGGVDLRAIESFVPGLEGTGGRVELSAVARGRPERPVLTGSAQLKDARTSLREWPVSVRALSGRLAFHEKGVRLEGIRGLLNDGWVTAGGEVTLAEQRVKRVAVEAQLEGVGVRLSDDLPFTTSGSLSLTGAPEQLALAGQLEVLRLRYTKGVELDELLRDVGRARAAVVTRQERPKELVSLSVAVRLGDVRVENNLARLRLTGDLLLTGTNARPGLLGSVQVAEGGRAFFRGNQFNVTSGSLEFTERYAFDPVVDLRAQTQLRHALRQATVVQEYLVGLHAFGRAREPQVLLSSEPSLPEAEILSLLTLGMFSGDLTAASTGAAGGGADPRTQMGLGLAAEALLSVSGLDREVQRFFPNTPLLKDPDFKVSTLYNEVTNSAEPTVQLESTVLTEQLKLQVSQPVVSGKGTRAKLEYRLDDQVSIQGQWEDKDNDDLTLGNPGLELKWNWELE